MAGGLGALAGGVFLTWLGDVHWTVGGVTLIPFQLLFLASLALRVVSWTLLFRVKTPDFDRASVDTVPEEAPAYIPSEASPEKAA